MAKRFKTPAELVPTCAALALLLAIGAGCGSSARPGSGLGVAGAAGAAGDFAGVAGAAGGSSGTGGTGVDAGAAGIGGGAGAAGVAADAGNAGAGGSAGMGAVDAGGPPAGWTLVFSDEFAGMTGAAPDASKWGLVNKGDGFGNNELQFYTNRTNNAATDGKGSLVITAIKEPYMNRNYTSAKLQTVGKFEQAYGRFEARMKLPYGQGIWPAFWMIGNNSGSVGWPKCGEIDIMENIGKEPSVVHGSLHGPGYSGGNPLTGTYTMPNGTKLADDFHVYAVEWEMSVVRFYIDDHLYETRTPADLTGGKTWVYDHPFTINLNVAVGGQWPGNPDQNTTFPQTMLVDYVRVYKRQ